MIAAIQPAMQGQEDLVALFSRNLTLDPVQAPPSEESKIIYISQHYNHSAHLANQQEEQEEEQEAAEQQTQQRPSSEPPQPEHQAVETLLRQHGVDTSALSASQIGLFKSADDAQKLRLIELWTICPPTIAIDNPTLAWTITSLEKEEILARMRLDRLQQQQQQQAIAQQQQQSLMSLDGTPALNLTPLQGGDGRWLQQAQQHYMEPYMSSGYEQLAAREYDASARVRQDGQQQQQAQQQAQQQQNAGDGVAYTHFGPSAGYTPATDPVWAARQQAMENQYGAFQRLREDEDML